MSRALCLKNSLVIRWHSKMLYSNADTWFYNFWCKLRNDLRLPTAFRLFGTHRFHVDSRGATMVTLTWKSPGHLSCLLPLGKFWFYRYRLNLSVLHEFCRAVIIAIQLLLIFVKPRLLFRLLNTFFASITRIVSFQSIKISAEFV